ncbi:MAG: hypothetical protein Sapg2KO_19990 [Saprospiraceae bacterium]
MRYRLGFFLLFLILQPAFGQQDASIPKLVLPTQNNEALMLRELSLRSGNRSPEFAVRIETLINPDTHGKWSEKINGQAVWQLQIESPEAHSLNFGFTKYHLPADATLLIYPPDKSKIYGPFTAADNEDHASLWTPIMQGDALVIEVNLPVASKNRIQLELEYVNHDFIGFGRVLSGDCHLDAVCGDEDGWPQLDKYRDVMQSVGLVSVDGRKLCTGFLVNNGREDCTPYFITANHCDISRQDARSMVVYWNYENSYCRTPNGFQSARPGDGILETYNTGAIFLASAEKSDFTLVRLDDPVVEEANAFLAGWDIGVAMPQDGVFSIHHPKNEEKRVAISTQIPFPGKWNAGATHFSDGDHLIVSSWNHGTTEEGSSGAPLFNSKKQVIGQLHGGRADCGNDQFDAFGWLRSAWKDGDGPSSRLKDWLDPDQEELQALGGRWAIQCDVALVADLAVQNACLPAAGSFSLSASDAFAEAIQLDLIYAPEGINIQLDEESLAPGASTLLKYETDEYTPAGIYTIVIRGSNQRDTVFTDLDLIIEKDPLPFDITVPSKNSKEVNESVLLQWENSPNSKSYAVHLAKDIDFTQIVDQFEVTDTFLRYDELDFASTYFWKVIAQNRCGQATSSVRQFNTAPDIRLLVLESPKPSCLESSLNFQIQLGVGFAGPSALSARVSPNQENVEISFGKTGVDALPGTIVDLQILRSQALSAGTYQLIVEADDLLRKGSVSIPFEILGTPPPVVLSAPINNTISLVEDVHFSWEAVDTNQSFVIEVSSDLYFNQSIKRQEVIGNNAHLQLDPGSYFWRVQSKNACSSNWSETYTVHVYQHDQVQLNGTRIFIEPTPSTGPLNLHFSELLEKGQIQVLNLQGEALLSQNLPEAYVVSLDLSSYPSGIYLIRIQARRSSVTKKIIIQR